MTTRFLLFLILLCEFSSRAFAQTEWFGLTTLNHLQERSRISLVFASQDEVSPVSYFGHTFLVFHNEATPELDAPLVEFLGQTSPEQGVPWKALFGSIPGRFQLQRFLYKVRQYDQENRDLWIYTLDLNPQERSELLMRIDQSLASEYPYQFTHKNCAYYLEKILQPKAEPSVLGTVPLAGVQQLIAQQKVASVEAWPSQRTRIRIAPSGQREAEEIRYLYSREEDPARRQDLFIKIKNLPASAPLRPAYEPQDFGGRRRVALRQSSSGSLAFTVAPYAQDFYTAAHALAKGSALRLLQSDLVWAKDRLSLESAELFHMEAASPEDAVSKEFVRRLDISYQRHLDVSQTSGWILRFATGKAYALNSRLLVSGKIFADLNALSDSADPLRPDAGLSLDSEISWGFAVKTSFSFQKSLVSKNQSWSRAEARLAWTLSPTLTLGLGVQEKARYKEYSAGLYLNL